MDKYDEAIAYFTEHPDEIAGAWFTPHNKYGCLFQFANKSGVSDSDEIVNVGCLTMIRNCDGYVCEKTSLTEEIRQDTRLAKGNRQITVESLSAMAEWNRRLDVELGRVPQEELQPS